MAPKASKPRIPRATMERAVSTLLKWIHSKKPSTSDSICVVLTLKTIPHLGRPFSFHIPLPHPFPHPTILLTSDHQHKNPNPKPLSLPVTDIVPFAEAETFHFPSSGLLLLDRRVERRLKKSSKIGIKKGVRVVKVDLAKESWEEEVRRECGLAEVRFGGGNGSTVKVGRGMVMSAEEVVENVAAAVEGVVGRVPRRWRNVRAVHLKAAESVALPMYEAVEEEEGHGEGAADGGEKKKRKREEEIL